MGSGRSRSGHNAPQLKEFGVFDEDNIAEIEQGEARQLHLAEGEMNDLSVPMNAHQIAIARTSGSPKRVAISVHKNSIDIHQPSSSHSRSFRKTTRLKDGLKTDEPYTIAGVKITLVDGDPETNTKQVLIENNSDGKDPIVDPKPYFPEPDNAISFDNMSGIWRNPEWAVQGLHIRYLPERRQLYVLWLVWDTAGRQRYYQGTLDVDNNNIAKGDMRDDENNEVVGSMMMYLNSENEAIFHAIEFDDRNWVMPLERLTIASDDDITGFYGTGNEEGIHLERVPDGRLVGYWVGTTEERSAWSATKIPFWRLIQEDLDTDTINIYDIENGYPLIAAKDVKLTINGQITKLEPNTNEDDSQVFDLEMEYDGKTISYPLFRLA